MPVTTDIDRARTRVRAERDDIAEKLDAFDSFVRRVSDISTDPTPSATGVSTVVGTGLRTDSASDDRCRQVRRAFAETLYPHSADDVDGIESLLESMREEFTDTVAAALAPTTEASFTPDLKRVVVSNSRARQAEAAAVDEALRREEAHLTDVSAAVDELTEWLVDANDRPLVELGFEALERRHERLADHRDRCERLAERRQEFLRRTTSKGPTAEVRHERLVPYLYEDFPAEHPVLATAAKLDSTFEECQRAVRDHLVRRV